MARTFTYRVNYAADVIASARRTSREFDNCFENGDGNQVVAALVQRAQKNERLAANLWRYIAKPDGPDPFTQADTDNADRAKAAALDALQRARAARRGLFDDTARNQRSLI